MTRVERTDRFNQSIIKNVTSIKLLDYIETLILNLESIPTLGSAILPDSIIYSFGDKVRKITCPPFLITYELFDNDQLVVIYDLIHERQAY